jgi:crotonobetainyl-CoA:carnitine CoA-transferase CaiB-like acyl-CoA transferase
VSYVNDMHGVFANPQIVHRKVRTTVDHPISGRLDLVRNPIHFSATPIEQYSAPPLLGEHTDEVLDERLDLTAAELSELANRGVI